MSNPTSNYGFVLPTSSDLVTDLPADFEVALQGVDTRLKALQPGTTLGDLAYSSATANTNTRLPIGTNGQVLAVSSGVPTWTTTADVTPLTTKGDLFTFTTVDARLGVGTNGQVLTADSTAATGLAWATPGALTLITTTSFSAAAAMSVNNCFSSTYTNYLIQFKLAVTSGTVDIYYKERSSGTDDSDFYYWGNTKVTNGGTVTGSGGANTTAFTICNTSTDGYGSIIVYSPNVATNTYYDWKTMDFSPNIVSGGGLHASTPTTCDGFSIIPASSTITGTVSVYGYSK